MANTIRYNDEVAVVAIICVIASHKWPVIRGKMNRDLVVKNGSCRVWATFATNLARYRPKLTPKMGFT